MRLKKSYNCFQYFFYQYIDRCAFFFAWYVHAVILGALRQLNNWLCPLLGWSVGRSVSNAIVRPLGFVNKTTVFLSEAQHTYL